MADSNQIIAASIQVDTGSSNANVQQLNKSLTDVKGNLSDTGAVASSTGKAVEETGGRFSKLKEGIASMPVPLGEAGEGVSKLSSTFKALLLNPVVATIALIVGGLALLYKSFTNTFEGGEKVEQIFAGIGAAAKAVLDRVFALGGAIIKFFSGDFSGAFADAKKAVTGIGDEITATYNKTVTLTAKIQDLNKEQRKQDLETAQRAAQLAKLREQLNDESVPIAEKKKAAEELRKIEKEAADKSLQTARDLADAKIELLKQGTDGEKKHAAEINQINIDLENKKTETELEGVRTNKVIRNLDKQDKAERKAEAQKEAEEAKKRRENLVEFNTNLTKLQQENELAIIKDSYEKEKKEIENQISDKEAKYLQDLQNKKITQDQYNQLLGEANTLQTNLLAKTQDKHNKDLADKEEAFQKELASIKNKGLQDSITDQRELERDQLKQAYEQKLSNEIKDYKDNAGKLQELKEALAITYRADQQKLEDKFRKDDEKKQTDFEISRAKKIADDNKKRETVRLKAVDTEQALFKKQFDDKIITEQEYNDKMAGLADARKNIRDQEKAHNESIAEAIAQTFGNLSDLVGKQTAVGKAFAVIQATIDTYLGAQKAYTAMADIPVIGPALGAIAAAAAIANGLATVKKIVAVQVPGQGGGSSPSIAGSTTATAPVTPAQVSTNFTGTQNPTTGTASDNRVYVLDSDVRNANERNERLNRAARLGGG